MKTALAFLLTLSSLTFAGEHKKSMGAHEHGALKLEIAAEGKVIEIDLDGPAESFLGFEHAPKTAKDKKIFTDAETLWNKDLFKLFTLDAKLGCSITTASFKQEVDGNHSEVEATAKITCVQDLKGQSLSVSLKKHYPHIKKLSLDLVATETKTFELKKAVESVKL